MLKVKFRCILVLAFSFSDDALGDPISTEIPDLNVKNVNDGNATELKRIIDERNNRSQTIINKMLVEESDTALLLRSLLQESTKTLRHGPVQQDIQLQNPEVPKAEREKMYRSLNSVDASSLVFTYYNSYMGNSQPVIIEFGNEKQIINDWLPDKPLKVVIHGWRGSDKDEDAVFAIKTAYVNDGDCNVIVVDWDRASSAPSKILYPLQAILTDKVGSIVAQLLENFVRLELIDPSDIHVIGHSLGAHVSGACGAAFSLGKIGRITGLDPAAPGFETMKMGSNCLDATDAEFVDVIHTAANTLGYSKPIGHADFYPNGGKNPQPGCDKSDILDPLKIVSMGCSHSLAHQYYASSVNHKNSFMAVQCPSWNAFLEGECQNNLKNLMGHDADPEARGVFYLKTSDTTPYTIEDNNL